MKNSIKIDHVSKFAKNRSSLGSVFFCLPTCLQSQKSSVKLDPQFSFMYVNSFIFGFIIILLGSKFGINDVYNYLLGRFVIGRVVKRMFRKKTFYKNWSFSTKRLCTVKIVQHLSVQTKRKSK
jgi:hypothetical protein